jgi:hypothetical protein
MHPVYLSTFDTPEIYHDSKFIENVGGADGLVPLMWLVLFREHEIVIRTRFGKPLENAKNVYPYLVTSLSDARARLTAAQEYLLSRLPRHAAPLFDEWLLLLNDLKLPYLHLDPKHLAFGGDPKMLEQRLRHALRELAEYSQAPWSDILGYDILPLKNRSKKSMRAFRAPLIGTYDTTPLPPPAPPPPKPKKFTSRDLSRERLGPSSVHGIHFYLPLRDPPKPTEWIAWLDELDQKACWRIYSCGPKKLVEVPQDYTGWFLQRPHLTFTSLTGVFFDTIQRDEYGTYMNIVKEEFGALALFRRVCAVVQNIPGVIYDIYKPEKIRARELQ